MTGSRLTVSSAIQRRPTAPLGHYSRLDEWQVGTTQHTEEQNPRIRALGRSGLTTGGAERQGCALRLDSIEIVSQTERQYD